MGQCHNKLSRKEGNIHKSSYLGASQSWGHVQSSRPRLRRGSGNQGLRFRPLVLEDNPIFRILASLLKRVEKSEMVRREVLENRTCEHLAMPPTKKPLLPMQTFREMPIRSLQGGFATDSPASVMIMVLLFMRRTFMPKRLAIRAPVPMPNVLIETY